MPDVFVVVSDNLDITLIDTQGITTSTYIQDPNTFSEVLGSDIISIQTVELNPTTNPAYTLWNGEYRNWSDITETWNETLRVYENRTEYSDISLLESVILNNQFNSSDTLNISLDDLSNILFIIALTSFDSLNVNFSENSSKLDLLLSILGSDRLDVSVETGSFGSLTSFLERIDEINVQLSEIKNLIVDIQTGDDLNVELTEVVIALLILLVVNSNDTIDLNAIESYGTIKSFLYRLDELNISLSELIGSFVSLIRSDTLDIKLFDLYSYPVFVSLLKKFGGYDVLFEKIETISAVIEKVSYDVSFEKIYTDSVIRDINIFDISIKRIR
jgi:hypothetical protein